jgi:transposase
MGSVGLEVGFVYNELTGVLKIVSCSYKNKRIYVSILYNNKLFDTNINNLRKGSIGSIIGIKTSQFKLDIGSEYKDNNRDLIITERMGISCINNSKSYRVTCRKCGWTNGIISESDLIRGRGCSCCNGKTIVEGINDIPTTAPWMVKYFQGGHDEAKLYAKLSNIKIFPICPDCRRVKDNAISISQIYIRKSIGCRCGDGKSYPEKFIASTFDQLNTKYVWGYSPEWLRGYKGSKYLAEFDFLLTDYNIIVECDGGLGHNKKAFGDESFESVEETRLKDEWKDEMASQNGFKVVRINADESTLEYMKNNISISLGSIINMQNINWIKCDSDAQKNIIKNVCIAYQNNQWSKIETIAEEFNIGRNTVTMYLKKGSQHGWCEYNTDNSRQRWIRNLQLSKIYPISIYRNDSLIAVYPSLKELIRRSEKEYKVKFSRGGVKRSMKFKTLYKGYRIEYVY